MVQKVNLAMTEDIAAEINSAVQGIENSLGTASERDVGNVAGGVYARGDISGEVVFDNPTGQTAVDYSELTESSDGWYIVQHSDVWTMIYIGEDYTSSEYSVMSKLVLTTVTPFVLTFDTIRIFGTEISALTQQYDATNGSANALPANIFKVVKV